MAREQLDLVKEDQVFGATLLVWGVQSAQMDHVASVIINAFGTNGVRVGLHCFDGQWAKGAKPETKPT